MTSTSASALVRRCSSSRTGHERPEIENVVERTEGFLLVEKVVAVDEIIREDPRSDEPGAD